MPAERPDAGDRRPPRLAERVLLSRLPAEIADALVGDLEHDYRTRLLPGKGPLRADLWYWRQVLLVRGGALRRAARRLRAVQPARGERRGRLGDGSGRFSLGGLLPLHPRDLRYALRRLARSPGFTLVAVLSLALGIGANTAMFSLVNSVLLRELPLRAPEELVEVYTSESDGFPYSTSSHPDFQDLRAFARENGVFSGVVGNRTFITRVEREGRPEVASGELVSWDYFDVLGVPMALGRSFLPAEDVTPGTHPVAILGHRTWVQDFGQDPAVLGRDVVLSGRPFTIVGVLPEAFTGSMPVLVTGFYVPLMMTEQLEGPGQLERRGSRSMFLKARLAPGVGLEQANEALRSFARGLASAWPETNRDREMSALGTRDVALHPIVDEALVPVAALLLVVVGLVLLIACANLASFLLARAEDRRKEIAVRLALGAGRGTLVRQLLLETLLLAALGGVAGLVLAHWTLGALLAFRPPLPIPVSFSVPLDRTVLLFTAAVSLAAGVLFGLAPALQATNPDLAPTIKTEGTGGGAPRRLSLGNGLVVVQVALSLVLLIGAGLFVRSLQKAQRMDPGFDTGPAALVWAMPEMSGYQGPDEIRGFLKTSRSPTGRGGAWWMTSTIRTSPRIWVWCPRTPIPLRLRRRRSCGPRPRRTRGSTGPPTGAGSSSTPTPTEATTSGSSRRTAPSPPRRSPATATRPGGPAGPPTGAGSPTNTEIPEDGGLMGVLYLLGIDATTGQLTREAQRVTLTGVQGNIQAADWVTADSVAFLAKDGIDQQTLYLVHREGGPARAVHRFTSEQQFSGIGIAPADRWAAYVAPASDGFFQVFRVSLDGGAPTQITADPTDKTQPAVSRDGSTVAFTVFSYQTQFWMFGGG